jgi:hypothetical protein
MTDPISEHIHETAKYNGMSYASIVQVAVEVESVKDDPERRKRLRREFKEEHALTPQVWARVADRCPDYESLKRDGIRAVAYMCQLTQSEFDNMFDAHQDHLNEPGAHLLVLSDVNTILNRKRTAAPRAPKAEPLAERIAEIMSRLIQDPMGDSVLSQICKQPEVAAALATKKRSKAR